MYMKQNNPPKIMVFSQTKLFFKNVFDYLPSIRNTYSYMQHCYILFICL